MSSAQQAGSAPTRPERMLTGPFYALMLTNGLMRFATYMLIALIPLYALQTGASPAVAGLTVTVFMVAAVVVRPASGKLVDQWGRYSVMMLGAALFCLATGAYVLSLPIWALLVARALQGFGFSFNSTAVMTLATDIIPESRMAQGIGILGLEQTVAQLFAPWLALELQSAFGYGVAFGATLVVAVANLLVRIPLGGRVQRADAERRAARAALPPIAAHDRGPWWHRVVDKNAWRPSLVMFVVMLGATVINTFLAAYALGRGIADAGLFFTVSGAAVGVSRLALGGMQRRIGPTPMIAMGIVLVGLGLVGVFSSGGLALLLVSAAGYGLGMGAVQPGLNSMAVLAADRGARGLASSTFFMAMDLSQAVGAVALGGVAALTGIRPLFLLAAAVQAVALVAFLALRSGGLLDPAHRTAAEPAPAT